MTTTTPTAPVAQFVLPDVRRLTINDVPCVAVSLSGLHGAGHEMLLDEADWRVISETITPWWSVAKMTGKLYVYSGCVTAAEIALQASKSNMLFLARHLAKPAPGRFVRFRDGNSFNLTRANLLVVDRSTHSKTNVEARRASLHQRQDALRSAVAAANAAALGEAA